MLSDFFIRELLYEEYEAASRLMWHTFYKFSSKNMTMAQIESFRDNIEPISLSINSYDGRMTLLGAFEESECKLIATGGIKLKTYPDEGKPFTNEANHITLLFTEESHHRKGIGKALVNEMLHLAKERAISRNDALLITVNSSDCALGFYEKSGFVKTGKRTVTHDSVYTPMEYREK